MYFRYVLFVSKASRTDKQTTDLIKTAPTHGSAKISEKDHGD
jgi:hypothetical protein